MKSDCSISISSDPEDEMQMTGEEEQNDKEETDNIKDETLKERDDKSTLSSITHCGESGLKSENTTNSINNNSNNNNNNNNKKLTFGIDSILKVETKRENDLNDYDKRTHNDIPKHHLNDTTNDLDYHGEIFGSLNTSDDEEMETDEFRINSAAFEAESARARFALLRYSTAFSSLNGVNGGQCVRSTGSSQHSGFMHAFSITNTGSGITWPSVAASTADGRKDRFGFIRRVGHPYQNRTPPKRKKPRTSFTRLQILELEKRFERQKYLASTERSALAKSLKMTDAQVKTWFQNRRTKWRRQTAEEREIERQAANRLLLSLQAEPGHRKSVAMPTDPVCLSHFQRWQDQRPADV